MWQASKAGWLLRRTIKLTDRLAANTKDSMPKAKSKSRTSAKLKRRKPVQCSAMVRPQWAIGQTVRHKLTGELFAVEAINDDYADLRPLISKITVTKWGFSHWEAAV